MITLRAPAKINLTLEVLSKRDDGYHSLRSVMVPIGRYDEIDLEPAADPSFRSHPAGLEADNLVSRALAAAGVVTPMRVSLRKRIPIGGGLGGGSSDAAAVLAAAIDGRLEAAPRDWIAVARALGSDVPFFLGGTGALVEGTGERVTACGRLPPWWTLVVQPHIAVPTSDAFHLLDASRNGAPGRARSHSVSLDAIDALQRCDFAALTALLSNDFHTVVLDKFPAVQQAYAALVATGSVHALLSGSGSCLFALFENEPDARAALARLQRSPVACAFVAPLVTDPAWR